MKMALKKLHDKIKAHYESGEFTTARSKQGTPSPLNSIIINVVTLLLLGLIISFPITRMMVTKFHWLYVMLLICLILNCIGLIISIGYYYYLKKTPNRNR